MELARQALAILLVFALLGAALFLLRRGALPRLSFRPSLGRGESALQRVERLPLTPQHTLHIVRIRGRELLIATHPHGCSVLADYPKERECDD
jgi:flagellar biogenesis protein FliO